MSDEKEIREKYITSVKDALNSQLKKSGKSVHALFLEVEKYKLGLNEGTFRKTFNYEIKGKKCNTLDTLCIVAACRYWGIDPSDVLVPHDTDEYAIRNLREHPLVSALNREGKFHALTNEKYLGDFTGYIVGPTPKDHKIGTINIHFEKVNGRIEATFTRTHPYFDPDNEDMQESQSTMRGLPLCSDLYGMIFIIFSNEKGDCQFVFFGYEDYRTKRGLIYRQGLSITGEAPNRPNLVAQNFVLFKKGITKGISKSKEKYIPGLLTLPHNVFYIEKEKVEALEAEHVEVKKFMEAYRDELNSDGCMVYPISEDSFLSKAKPKIPVNDIIKALLLLKSESDVPKKAYYQADSKYSAFSIDYMLKSKSSNQNQS